MPSNFNSPTPGSASWRSGASSCSSTGISVLANAQTAILDEMPSAAVTPVNDPTSPDGWNANSLNALAALLDRYGHTSDSAAVRRNIGQGQITLQTMRAFLWAANSTAVRYITNPDGTTRNAPIHTGSPSAYTIDADAVMPAVGSMPEFPLNAYIGDAPQCAPTGSIPGVNTPTTTITQRANNPLLFLALLGAATVTGVILFEAARADKKW